MLSVDIVIETSRIRVSMFQTWSHLCCKSIVALSTVLLLVTAVLAAGLGVAAIEMIYYVPSFLIL